MLLNAMGQKMSRYVLTKKILKPVELAIRMTPELEERFRELASAKTVRGVLILNSDGAPIKTNMDPKSTEAYANMMHEIVGGARRIFLEQDPGRRVHL